MFGCAVNRAVWTLLSPGERSEEPPAENQDSVLDFEDIDNLPAHDLDRITAWMESMLASLCQLGKVRVNIPSCLCLMACAVYLCCLPMHLPDVQKTAWHVWYTCSHALSHTFRSAITAVM
jgi:hypothetical protein